MNNFPLDTAYLTDLRAENGGPFGNVGASEPVGGGGRSSKECPPLEDHLSHHRGSSNIRWLSPVIATTSAIYSYRNY